MIGLALNIGGRRIASPDLLGSFLLLFKNRPGAWGTGAEYQKRQDVADRVDRAVARNVIETGTVPIDMDDVKIGRLLIMAFALLAVAAMGMVSAISAGWRTGFVAALLFVLHPIAMSAYSWVLNDTMPLALSILAVLGMMMVSGNGWKASRCPRLTAFGLSAYCGGMLALACGAKMNALIVVVLAAGVFLYFLVAAFRRRERRDNLVKAAIMGGALLFAGVLFVALNPALYPDLVDGLKALVMENHRTAHIQEGFLGGGLHSPLQRLPAIARLVGVRPVVFVLVVACAVVQTVRSIRSKSPWLIVVGWWWIGFIMVAAWLPFAWDRYVLPLIPSGALLVARTMDEAVEWSVGKIRHKKEQK